VVKRSAEQLLGQLVMRVDVRALEHLNGSFAVPAAPVWLVGTP